MKKEIWAWGKSIIIAFIIALICRQFFFTPVKVVGESMQPTLQNNNMLIVSKVSEFDRLDVVAFKTDKYEESLIKRIIGLPGDLVEVKDDVLYINGEKVDESYLDEYKNHLSSHEVLTEDLKITVPKGSLFVMGDNREVSLDSRIFGFISEDDVIGEVKFRYFPIGEIGIP
ncbi:signal peptidase I [Bacillus carboniphilus]|uniref:Signal peptidase I n=1 Tax=Bacillus carboniphilus TaxID=86663 RepID=A0ABY9K3G4_9BACI|nr:signal peptidase I [Bacillus carboniphilus]WLR44330.1 signal peptidase I [Bacillus carboniphilus]